MSAKNDDYLSVDEKGRKLLARPGSYDGRNWLFRRLNIRKSKKYAGYESKEGFMFHGPGKRVLRKLISMGYSRYKGTVERKRGSQGYVKAHIAAYDEAWQWVRGLDHRPMKYPGGPQFGVQKGDVNDEMFQQITGVAFAMLDEDSFYDIRVLLWLKWIHEHWDRIEIAVNQAYALTFGFDKLYRNMVEWSKPLPQDKGRDFKEPDYVRLEKNAKKIVDDYDGMDSDGQR